VIDERRVDRRIADELLRGRRDLRLCEVIGDEQLGQHGDRRADPFAGLPVRRVERVNFHRLFDPMLTRRQKLPPPLDLPSLHLPNLDRAQTADGDRIEMVLMAEDRNRVPVAEFLHIELAGGVVDRRGARNRPALRVAANVALRVGRRDGFRHRDFARIDHDRYLPLQVLRRDLNRGDEFAGQNGPELSPAAIEALNAFDWSGNVRQLRNCLERAILLADNGMITPRELPPEIAFRTEKTNVSVSYGSPSREPVSSFQNTTPSNLRDVERQQIIGALEKTGWHRGKTAELLGNPPSTPYRRLREYDLDLRTWC